MDEEDARLIQWTLLLHLRRTADSVTNALRSQWRREGRVYLQQTLKLTAHA